MVSTLLSILTRSISFSIIQGLIGDPCPYGGWFGVSCNDYIVDQVYVQAINRIYGPTSTISLIHATSCACACACICNISSNLPHNNLTGTLVRTSWTLYQTSERPIHLVLAPTISRSLSNIADNECIIEQTHPFASIRSHSYARM